MPTDASVKLDVNEGKSRRKGHKWQTSLPNMAQHPRCCAESVFMILASGGKQNTAAGSTGVKSRHWTLPSVTLVLYTPQHTIPVMVSRWPWRSSGGQSPASHRGVPGSSLAQVMWDTWRTQQQWGSDHNSWLHIRLLESSKQLKTVYYCMPHDDGRMTETCCGNNIRGGEEELLRWRTINCLISFSTLVSFTSHSTDCSHSSSSGTGKLCLYYYRQEEGFWIDR
jgi:hypothetical protein